MRLAASGVSEVWIASCSTRAVGGRILCAEKYFGAAPMPTAIGSLRSTPEIPLRT